MLNQIHITCDISGLSLIGDIVLRHPPAGNILLKRHINYCCRNDSSLVDVCSESGIDVMVVVNELRSVLLSAPASPSWLGKDMRIIIGYILSHYNLPIRSCLEDLHRLLDRLLLIEPPPSHFLLEIDRLFTPLHKDLVRQFSVMENTFFPLLLKIADQEKPGISQHRESESKIKSAKQELSDHSTILFRLIGITEEALSGSKMDSELFRFSSGLKHLSEQVMQLICIENHLLFKKALER